MDKTISGNFGIDVEKSARVEDIGEIPLKGNANSSNDSKNINNILYKDYSKIHSRLKGFNIMPCPPNQKHPGEWKAYQAQKYDIEAWASNPNRYYRDSYEWNFCIICGKISDNLEIIDIEDYQIYDKFFKGIETFVVKTPNGGVHIYFLSDNPLEKSFSKYLDSWPIDVRTNGGLIMIPPSRIDGKYYEVLIDLPIKKIEGNAKRILEEKLPTLKRREETDDFDIEKFKKNIRIGDVANKYTKPERHIKKGWQGFCPFHNENNPSFTVYEDTERFYCFSCGEGGDVIDFIEKVENLDFRGAVEHLSKEYNLNVDLSSFKRKKDKNGKTDIFKMVEQELYKHPSNQMFIGDNKDAYLWLADKDGNNRICRKIGDEEFNIWLLELYYQKTRSWPKDCIAKEVSLSLKALGKSITEKKGLKTKIDTFYQIGKVGNALWYDLGREDWLGVEITSDGWRKKPLPPGFIRAEGAKEQVEPSKGGDLNDIFDFVNITEENDKILYKADVITSFIYGIEHPVSYFTGTKGSAKSTVTKITVDMVNPIDLNKDLLNWPSDKEALGLALNDSASQGFDNITSMNKKFSDTICMVVTGGKDQKRSLYTNGGKFSITYRAKIVMNGINLVGLNFPDLMDRMIVYDLETPAKRKPREKILLTYKEKKAKLLGAVFDHIVKAMKIIDDVKEQELDLPRLAGFAVWGEAIAQSNWNKKPGEFTEIYSKKRNELSEETVKSDELANTLLSMVRKEYDIDEKVSTFPAVIEKDGIISWEGTATELLEFLNEIVRQKNISTSRYWPKNSIKLGAEINKVKRDLEKVGLKIEKKKSGDRLITMSYKIVKDGSAER